MSLPADIRPRVQRLLEGRQKPLDIGRLFEAMRFTDGLGRAARDVGDFAAHRDERDRGLTWSYGRAFCASQRLFVQGVSGVTPSLDDIQTALIARNSLLTDQELASVGHNRASAKALMKAICTKLSGHDGTKPTFNAPLVGDELALFTSLMAWRGIPLAFDDTVLATQLADALVAAGALEDVERAPFMQQRGAIVMFALSLMHGSKIDLTSVPGKNDGKAIPGEAHMEITSDSNDPSKLAVYCHYKPEFEPRMMPLTRIVATDCKVTDWVSVDIQPHFIGSTGYSGPLDIDDDGRLAPF